MTPWISMPGGYWGDVLAHLSIELLANFVLFSVFVIGARLSGGKNLVSSWRPRSIRKFDLFCDHNIHRAIGIMAVFAMDVVLAMFTVRLVG